MNGSSSLVDFDLLCDRMDRCFFDRFNGNTASSLAPLNPTSSLSSDYQMHMLSHLSGLSLDLEMNSTWNESEANDDGVRVIISPHFSEAYRCRRKKQISQVPSQSNQQSSNHSN